VAHDKPLSATPVLDSILEHHEKNFGGRIRQAIKKFRKVRRLRKVNKIITLADAIRRAHVRQAIGELESGDGAFCVWGAAAVGIGLTEKDESRTVLTVGRESEVARRFTHPKNNYIACPATDCGENWDSLKDTLIHLNDEHEWSLAKIALWVEKNYPEVKTKEKVEIRQYVIEEVEVEEKA
jgi:hypothetical protein